MDSIPIVFVAFKLLAFGTCMFFAIKWHYDQEQKEKAIEKRAAQRAAGTVAAVFLSFLLGLGLFTFTLCRMVGLDLTFP